jgi:hypothetical protein
MTLTPSARRRAQERRLVELAERLNVKPASSAQLILGLTVTGKEGVPVFYDLVEILHAALDQVGAKKAG